MLIILCIIFYSEFPSLFLVMLQASCIIFLKQGNCQNDPVTLEISLLQYVTTLLEYYNATYL